MTQVEQDVSKTEGSRHLWETVDEANDVLSGATRDYVDQD